jgi:hypothetical protein
LAVRARRPVADQAKTPLRGTEVFLNAIPFIRREWRFCSLISYRRTATIERILTFESNPAFSLMRNIERQSFLFVLQQKPDP